MTQNQYKIKQNSDNGQLQLISNDLIHHISDPHYNKIKNRFMEYYKNKQFISTNTNLEKLKYLAINDNNTLKKKINNEAIKKKQKDQNTCSVMTQQFQQVVKKTQGPKFSLMPIQKPSKNISLKIKSDSIAVKKILNNQTKSKKQYINYKNFHQLIESYHDFQQMELKQVLGVGANAIVRLASDSMDNYAIKIYQKYKLIDPNKLKSVYKEINLLKKLQHNNIPYLYNAFEDKKQIHIIMQYTQGITLQKYFKANNYNLPIETIKIIIKQLVNAISYLHEIDICHRDIKLENILINTKTHQIKLIDFGYATYHNLKSVLSCGTPSYMAPQLYEKNCSYDPKKVDVWAIGITIYYLVNSFLPFKGYDQKDLIRKIKSNDYSIKMTDQKLIQLMGKLLQQDPLKRIDCNRILESKWFQKQIGKRNTKLQLLNIQS